MTELLPSPSQPPPNLSIAFSYDEARSFKKEGVWRNLATITVGQAIEEWLTTLGPLTRKNYISGMKRLADLGLLSIESTLQAFSLANHEAIIDRIKQIASLSEATKQARAACYISFTRFLSRRTQQVIEKAVPSREGSSKTFYRVREKVATKAMNRAQWNMFLRELYQLNPRDCLLAKVMLQGGKRVSEVLFLSADRIDWANSEITFVQSKMKGAHKETVITYPQVLMEELRIYVGARTGLAFVTKRGGPIGMTQLARTFATAGLRANIPFKVTPHVLRASAVTYFKQQGFGDGDIMRVTGHSSAEMVYAYDKSALAENATKRVSLIS